jgi:NAD(P)-dependent dehydrogenase (short-subunit alcohol dehydrogenase family)
MVFQFDFLSYIALSCYGYALSVPLARAAMLECNPSKDTITSLFIGALFAFMSGFSSNPTGRYYWTIMTIIFAIYTYTVQLRGPIPQRVNMRGKTIVVTGANSGIGLETTRQLCQMGATVIMGCRSLERSRPMMDDVNGDNLVKKSGGKAILLSASLDLNSLKSVRRWTQSLLESGYTSIDSLVCNAGLFIQNLSTHTETINFGKKNQDEVLVEDSFVSNHLGHHLLMHLLLPNLHQASVNRIAGNKIERESDRDIVWEQGSPSRIVLVSSSLHKLASKTQGSYQFLDWYKSSGSEKPSIESLKNDYNQWVVYGGVKLAEMLSARHLEKLIQTSAEYSKYKNSIHINTLHPGNPVTGVTANLPFVLRLLEKMFYPFMFLYRQTCTLGAYNTVWVTTHPEALQGQNQYYIHMEPSVQNEAVYDVDAAKKIYEYSEYLCQE